MRLSASAFIHISKGRQLCRDVWKILIKSRKTKLPQPPVTVERTRVCECATLPPENLEMFERRDLSSLGLNWCIARADSSRRLTKINDTEVSVVRLRSHHHFVAGTEGTCVAPSRCTVYTLRPVLPPRAPKLIAIYREPNHTQTSPRLNLFQFSCSFQFKTPLLSVISSEARMSFPPHRLRYSSCGRSSNPQSRARVFAYPRRRRWNSRHRPLLRDNS